MSGDVTRILSQIEQGDGHGARAAGSFGTKETPQEFWAVPEIPSHQIGFHGLIK
jgi:hypothetical protein